MIGQYLQIKMLLCPFYKKNLELNKVLVEKFFSKHFRFYFIIIVQL